MLLDMLKYNDSIDSIFKSVDRMISISFKPNFNNTNVTSMSSLFSGCFLLKSIDLSNFDTSNARNMLGMFHNCYSLISLNLSNFDTSNVKNMYGMFYNCSSLTSINLSNFNTSKVIMMNSMFYNCSNPQYINILNFRYSHNIISFANYIPDSGTIITNKEFFKKINYSYFNRWNIILY